MVFDFHDTKALLDLETDLFIHDWIWYDQKNKYSTFSVHDFLFNIHC